MCASGHAHIGWVRILGVGVRIGVRGLFGFLWSGRLFRGGFCSFECGWLCGGFGWIVMCWKSGDVEDWNDDGMAV